MPDNWQGRPAWLVIEPCLPTVSRPVPIGPGWAYEIKHDGFRFICHRDGERVRVFSRNGHDWSARLPAIVAALRALPIRSVILDGEGVICGSDGVSDFDRMRAMFGRTGSPDAFLYAFDVLESDGRDLRAQRWDARRTRANHTQVLTAAASPAGLAQYLICPLKSIVQIPAKQIGVCGEEFSGGPTAHEYLRCA